MISARHWPNNWVKFARFGDFSGPETGLLSRYLPERQLWWLCLLLPSLCLTALEHGGDFEARNGLSQETPLGMTPRGADEAGR